MSNQVEILSPMYSHMTGQLDALNLDVSELIWNEGKLHRAPVLGELYTSDKQKSTIYRPRRHRRERAHPGVGARATEGNAPRKVRRWLVHCA